MRLPEFNPLARPALLGLTYRALAANAVPGMAIVNRRRLEANRLDHTKLLQDRSVLDADLKIASEKLGTQRQRLIRAEEDLALFAAEHGQPTRQRGRVSSVAQQRVEQQRSQLAHLHKLAQQEFRASQRHHGQLTSKLKELKHVLSNQGGLRTELTNYLEEQLAAQVLGYLAADELDRALEAMRMAREVIRGNLMLAILAVLFELFVAGAEAASEQLNELRPVFEQHTTPVHPQLSVLLALCQHEPVSLTELKVFAPEQFAAPAFLRFDQLVRVLAGFPLDGQLLSGDPIQATLWALRECLQTLSPATGLKLHDAAGLASWSASGDTVIRLLCCHALAQRGELPRVLTAAGIDTEALMPVGGISDFSPALLPLVSQQPAAWPPEHCADWQAALACHLLYAAKEHAPTPLFAAWEEESYDWPKSDLYWWVLGIIKDDVGLMSRNLSGSVNELFSVAPV